MLGHSHFFWREAKEQGVVVQIQTDYSKYLITISGYNPQIVWGLSSDKKRCILVSCHFLQNAKFERSVSTIESSGKDVSSIKPPLFWEEVMEKNVEVEVTTITDKHTDKYHIKVSGYNPQAIWGTTRTGEAILLNAKRIVTATYTVD